MSPRLPNIYLILYLCCENHDGTIEDDELSGFIKDLLESVREVKTIPIAYIE